VTEKNVIGQDSSNRFIVKHMRGIHERNAWVHVALVCTAAEFVELQRPMARLADGRDVPAGDMQRVLTGQPPRPQLVPQVAMFVSHSAGASRGTCAVVLACPALRRLNSMGCRLAPASPPPMRLWLALQFGYISLFPLLMRLIPPDSPILGRQLELVRDEGRLWTPYGLRSLRHAPHWTWPAAPPFLGGI
jgi:hypothetical protein